MRSMPAKIERSTSLPSTPRAAAVSRANPAAPGQAVAQAKVPAAVFAGQAAAPARELTPAGQPVATSADPSALWGATAPATTPASTELTREAFTALSADQQVATLESLRTERAELGQQIEARVEQLDRRWRHSRLSTRTEALRHYEGASERMPRGRRRELRAHVEKAVEAQARIDELTARVAELPKTPEAKSEQAALRDELAKELRRARDEQSKAVAAATALIDQEGLKVDRLGVTEQLIDPSAPAPGSGGSLLEKVARFFKLDSFISTVFSWVEQARTAEVKREEARAEQKRSDEKTRQDKTIERIRGEQRRLDGQLDLEAQARTALARVFELLPSKRV